MEWFTSFMLRNPYFASLFIRREMRLEGLELEDNHETRMLVKSLSHPTRGVRFYESPKITELSHAISMVACDWYPTQ